MVKHRSAYIGQNLKLKSFDQTERAKRKTIKLQRKIYMSLSFHIGFNGQCREAFEFYAEHLNGTIGTMLEFKDPPIATRNLQTAIVLNVKFSIEFSDEH